ncbi:hypothetical protein SDRG_03376 [Saprolegnia diclina VS20]|uniref:Uncharacterized protein n=1 Tax=Saprolegnia diclina (strain VS20) TaxID=1156394 RepID=T0QYL7_SAPDV|nr:hypothetical protein SDRG_03376 [Saprolegnia diclina VS20]EQC39170.1 hypothetical protein SDRG_03376 [Saprolegnia diclina VS20]|eukprot:XP_008607231.1 hypothetical protein SDRG_03376 [Saprolegnia diclina VS20]
MERGSKGPSFAVIVVHLVGNLIAGCLVLLSLVTLVALLSQGMAYRMVVAQNYQDASMDWAPLGNSCVLTQHGFVADSCSTNETNVTTLAAWTAIGRVLAQQWALPDADAWSVTTCMVGSKDVGYFGVTFLAGYAEDPTPECLPTGAQAIAAMASLETMATTTYPSGAYLVTTIADSEMMAVDAHLNSDGTTSRVFMNATKAIVTVTGDMAPVVQATNWRIQAMPLGPRYAVETYCQSLFLDLTPDLDALAGYSAGKQSQAPIVNTWNCGNHVSNANEIAVAQVVFACIALLLLHGDAYITIEGFSGLLRRKPILTYDVLSGMEQRLLLVASMVLSALPSLLYADVARIYAGTTTGAQIWVLSLALLGVLVAFGVVLLVGSLQRLPLPFTPTRVLPYSARIFLSLTIFGIVGACYPLQDECYNDFYSTPPALLGLSINGIELPAGAYDPNVPVTSVLTLLVSTLGMVTAAALATAVLMSMLSCATNAFLQAMHEPRWLTSVPLHQSSAIRFGNKMFCKPSTMAMLGYIFITPFTDDVVSGKGSLVFPSKLRQSRRVLTSQKSRVDSAAAKYASHADVPVVRYVVSIYALVLATALRCIACGYRCHVYGTVTKDGSFTKLEQVRLDETQRFMHSRGVCVN